MRLVGNRSMLLRNIVLSEKQNNCDNNIQQSNNSNNTNHYCSSKNDENEETNILELPDMKKNKSTKTNKVKEIAQPIEVVKNKELNENQRIKLLNEIGEHLKDFRRKPKKGGSIKIL